MTIKEIDTLRARAIAVTILTNWGHRWQIIGLALFAVAILALIIGLADSVEGKGDRSYVVAVWSAAWGIAATALAQLFHIRAILVLASTPTQYAERRPEAEQRPQ